MRMLLLAWFFVASLHSMFLDVVFSEHYCLSNLTNLINQTVSTHADWTIGIEARGYSRALHVDSSGPEKTRLLSMNAHQWLNPASTNKLLTSSAMLVGFYDPHSRFSTDVYHGDGVTTAKETLVLLPRGDPTLTYDRLTELLRTSLADYPSGTAVRILVDPDTYFGAPLCPETPLSWELVALASFHLARPISAVLNMNQDVAVIAPGKNLGDPPIITSVSSPIPLEFDASHATTVSGTSFSISLRVSFQNPTKIVVFGKIGIDAGHHEEKIAVLSPADHFVKVVKLFASRVAPQGVTVDVIRRAKSGMPQPAHLKHRLSSSATLLEIMNHTLLVSDNTCAELFLRHVGVAYGGTDEDACSAGIEGIRSFLTSKVGLSTGDFRQADGSGVSRETFVSPHALVEVLDYMRRTAPVFRHLLPVAGVSGTLEHRFLRHKRILEAKTGTLPTVGALAGYIHAKYFDTIVFSILVNDSGLGADEIRKHIDRIALYLAFVDPSC